MLFVDRLFNLVSSLGTAKDKATSTRYFVQEMDQQQALAAYRSDWIARKVVDIPAFDMIRERRHWQAKAPQIEALEATEARLQVWPKLAKALKLARLYGGSAIILGTGDTNTAEPLDVNRVGTDGLSFIHVASRYEITAGQINRDAASEHWGEPVDYTMNTSTGAGLKLHPSRVIPFIGSEVPDLTFSHGWGDSILQVLDEAVKNAGLAAGGIAQLLQEAKVDVFKIPNFMANVGDEAYRNKVLERVALAQQSKSIVNGLLMDAEEEWNQKQISFTQLPEVLRLYLQIAAGAADIPATRLLGQSPDGLNATGEGDLRNYYDRLASEQEVYLRPRLERLDEVLIRSALGSRPPEIHFAFAPLWQISEKEKADIFKLKADGARAIAGNGGTSEPLMPIEALSDALVNSFIEDGSLPGLESAIDEYGKLSEQPEDDAGQEEAALPPIQPVEANDAAPRTLYVQRKLLNASELIAWAKAQGFKTTTPAEDMHVTVAFSRVAVDWMKAGEAWTGDKDGKLTVNPGGARLVEKLGDKGAVVLLFNSSELSWRHEAIRRDAGASWDFPEYQPHVTITYAGGDLDLSRVEPYRGKLVFGPEIFEEIDDDWTSRLKEA
ncbi:anti-CBASS protein Acb1 family protein [Phenylobacterium sp.]|uniref:anti-CBASS protein Acb1 family protein n=1 Tax=Phenylobacterium sp. TaxID=1871053 RepID=UPI003001D8FA